MLIILNKYQETVGVASNSNPLSLSYFDDIHTETLEGVHTYAFSVANNHEDSNLFEVEGHVIFKNLDGENLLFTIKEINAGRKDGNPIKEIFCEETAVSELLNDVQRPLVATSTALPQALDLVMANSTDWEIADVPDSYSIDLEFSDYMTLLEALRQLAVNYNKELYFTVELRGTKIARKCVNFVDQRGEVSNVRFDYGYDLIGVSRTENSENIVTALIGIGKGDKDTNRVNLTKLGAFKDGDFYKDDGSDWIGSESALQMWGRNGKHRFGIYINEDADTPQELQRKTIKELEKRIKPYVHYSTSTVNLERLTGYEAKKVRLGDTVIINDKTFNPPIVIEGRVKELERSYTQNDNDKVTLGSYKPVTLSPNQEIKDLQKIISRKEALWDSSGYVVTIQALQGVAFRNGSGTSTLRAKVVSGGTELDIGGTDFTYKWFKHTKNGVLIPKWGGTTDYRTGKEITLTGLDVDEIATIVVQVDDGT